jgi:hypothetical protein
MLVPTDDLATMFVLRDTVTVPIVDTGTNDAVLIVDTGTNVLLAVVMLAAVFAATGACVTGSCI